MSASPLAKKELLDTLDQWISDHEGDPGVATQQNVIYAREIRRTLEKLNYLQAELVLRAIKHKEHYDPAKDKFGFGPVKVSPLSYDVFAREVCQASQQPLWTPENAK